MNLASLLKFVPMKKAAILAWLLAMPAYAAEKASATMQVTATVVGTSETATGVVVVDDFDENGDLVMRTYVYRFEG